LLVVLIVILAAAVLGWLLGITTAVVVRPAIQLAEARRADLGTLFLMRTTALTGGSC